MPDYFFKCSNWSKTINIIPAAAVQPLILPLMYLQAAASAYTRLMEYLLIHLTFVKPGPSIQSGHELAPAVITLYADREKWLKPTNAVCSRQLNAKSRNPDGKDLCGF